MILLIAGLILLGVFLIKYKELKHRIAFAIIISLILLLFASSYNVFKNNDVDLGSFDGVMTLTKLYFNTLFNLVKNVGKISTFAVKQDWGVNSSNLSLGL